ncbi:MAG: MBL fold metallo-hydrolase [Chloroflexi bacterium]|nr:MBL fold metallo-hydrolase [Chloroflexota bacterium]
MRRQNFPINVDSKENWDDVFSSPGNVELHTFETGKATVPLSGMINLKHPKAEAMENEKIQVPIMSHLVRHERFGDFLIDCGLDVSFQRNPYGTMKGLLVKIIMGESCQDKGRDIATHLRERGIEVKGVFLTHLHFDHVAGALNLPKDIQYVVGKGERYLNIKFLYEGNHLQGVETLYEIDFDQAKEMPILGRCADIFGDGTLWAIPTPGHTGGHTSFLVNGREKVALIAGDACALEQKFTSGIGPGSYSVNVKMGQESLDKMIKFVGQHPQVEMICGH